jgi:hypothetical protein
VCSEEVGGEVGLNLFKCATNRRPAFGNIPYVRPIGRYYFYSMVPILSANETLALREEPN